MKTTVLSFSLAAVLAAGSLPAIAQNAAVVNGKAIPSAKLDKLIAGTGQPDNPELRKRGRDMLIDRELLSQEANKRGLTQRDDVQEQLEQARLNVLAGAVFEDYVKTHGASDAELRKQYDKIKSQFGNGKEYHARHILVEKEADAKAIIAKINADVATVRAMPDIQKRMQELGFTPEGGSPEEFGAFVKADLDRWRKVVRDTGVKVD